MIAWPSSEFESLLESPFESEYAEAPARRPPVRTPSNQSSFTGRPNPNAASQSQVQSTARNLDAKIEQLSAAVKAVETRVNGIAADQQRIGAAVKKEIDERKKADDGIRADLQQTKTLSVLLPFMTNSSVDARDINGNQIKVVTKTGNQIGSLLPFLLLLTPTGGGTDASKGPLGGDSSMLLLLAALLSDR